MQRRNFVLAGASLVMMPVPGRPAHSQGADDNAMPEALRTALERDPTAPVLGNADGDITLTQFFDYNCPSCRKMVAPLAQLIRSDPALRVVFREWPIFGDESEAATRVSLASLQQGKYWQMHSGLFRVKGRVNGDAAMQVARDLGLDLDRLTRDMTGEEVEKHITQSFLLADHMGLVGTPSYIAGNEGAFGEYSLSDLRAMIGRGRKALAG